MHFIGKDCDKCLQDIQLVLESLEEMDLLKDPLRKPRKATLPAFVDTATPQHGAERATVQEELDDEHETKLAMWNQRLKECTNRETAYASNKTKVHYLILGQCELGVVSKLKQRKDWTQNEGDPIKSLIAIEEITHDH